MKFSKTKFIVVKYYDGEILLFDCYYDNQEDANRHAERMMQLNHDPDVFYAVFAIRKGK